MNVRTLFRQLPSTAYLYALLAASVIGGISYFVHAQRVIGARDEALKASRAVADTLAGEIKIARKAREAAEAKSARDSVALLASRRSVRIAAALSDSAVSEAKQERARVLALVADSGATLAQMRAGIVTLAATSARAEAMHAQERAAWVKDSTAANGRIVSLGEALAAAHVENERLVALNANLHRQIKLVERDKAGFVVRYVVPAVALAAGVAIGH